MENPQKVETQDSLLFRYFAGEASFAERTEVEDWLNACDENREIAKDLYAIYLASDILRTVDGADVSEAYHKAKQQTGRAKNKISQWKHLFQRIAAILLLPLLIALGYYMTRKEPLQFIEYRTNPGMVARVDLPDGSQVWLNSSTWLRHPRTFIGENREVEIEGEAYFDVERDKNKRFIVHTPTDLKVEVLGTEFNIEAYAGEQEVKTTLVSGSVKLSYRDNHNREKEHILSPNEEYTYNIKTKEAVVDQPYVPTLTAWKDGSVILKNTPFEETLKILSKRFNVEFVVKNAKLYDNYFTYTSDSQQLSLFLDAFKISSGIQYRFVEPAVPVSDSAVSPKTVVELY